MPRYGSHDVGAPVLAGFQLVDALGGGRDRVIELGGKTDALRKNETRAWHGLLHRRNECAHPEDVYPGLNEALGYIDELFKRIAALQKRPWP